MRVKSRYVSEIPKNLIIIHPELKQQSRFSARVNNFTEGVGFKAGMAARAVLETLQQTDTPPSNVIELFPNQSTQQTNVQSNLDRVGRMLPYVEEGLDMLGQLPIPHVSRINKIRNVAGALTGAELLSRQPMSREKRIGTLLKASIDLFVK